MVAMPGSGNSFWMKDIPKPSYPRVGGVVDVDVAVIGAGIAGLTTAYELKRRGLRVAVVERSAVGSGVSGYTTGKVTSQHNLIYAKLVRRLGEDTARQYAQMNQEAIAQMERIIANEQIDCGWQMRDNYVFTADQSRIADFKREAEVAQSLGLPASYEDTVDLPFSAAAVRFSAQAHVHIRKYLVGLARAVDGSGSFVFEQSKVTGIHEPRRSRLGRLVVKDGGEVRAKDIVVASNVPTFPLLARGTYCIAEYPQQSYIVAGRADTMPSGMYISPDSGHYSILSVEHGGEALLLIGGEGHIPGTRLSASKRYERLAEYGKQHFGMHDVKYSWTHMDYLGYDDMPLIGPLYPWSKHIFTATGFMKWGLTNGTGAAMLLADIVTGVHNPFAPTFNPHRPSSTASIAKVIGENIGIIKPH